MESCQREKLIVSLTIWQFITKWVNQRFTLPILSQKQLTLLLGTEKSPLYQHNAHITKKSDRPTPPEYC